MGAPELHLSSDAPARRFAVAGESMEFLLRTGDVLYAARGGGPARAGDVVLTMGKDAPVLAHRVLLSVCGRLLTKGDFHFLTDGLAAPEAVVGRVLAVERDGLRVWLDCGWARAAGLGAAGYSLAGALLYRAAQLLLWLAGGLALSLGWTRLQRRLETAHLTAVRAVLRRPAEAVFRALARHTLRRHGGEIDAVLRGLPDAGKDASVVWAAGEIARDTEWSGEVRVSGDVVVLPGAALTLRPGTRVLFLAGKRFHHGVRRRRGGRSVPLTDSRGSHLVVYGRLRVLGEGSAPVFFEASSGPWGGILLLGGEGHELRHAELAVSRGGLSCADEVRLEASDLRFIGTRDCAVRCAGQAGARLERCRFEGGREGLCVEEGARAALAGASFRGVRVAVLARGDAQVSLESCRVDGMGAAGSRGFLFEDEVRGEAKDCETVGCDIGQTLQGRARLALRESRFLKNKIGLACADGSAVSAAKTSFSDNADANVSLAGGEHHLSDCVLQGSAAGLRASGAARLTLEGGRVAGSSGDGLMLAEAAEGRVRAVVFEGNKTAIVLCGRTRLAAEGVRGDKNRGHGLWLQDAASASLQGGGFLGNGDNGIYLTGRSRLELSGGEFQGNRCGLACADESAASAAGTSFSDSREANVSLTGGEHRLEGCSLRGAPVGAGAVGKALLAMTKCAILESREVGLSLAEEAQAKSQADFFAGNRIGIALCGAARLDASGARVEKSAGHGLWLKDSAAASLEGGGFSGNQDNGIYLSGTARLELSQSELKGNRCGLACADESAASAVQTAFAENQETNVSLTGGEHRFVRCAFRGSAAGLSVVDKARVELAGGGISGSSGEGLALAGEAEARSKDAVFDGNRTGIALCGKARLLAEAVRVESSRGHGLWLKDAASASLQGGGFVSNGDNGAYLTGQSRLELLMSEFTGNRCGLACADASAARAVKTAFADNAETNVSLTGGEHRFADCSLRGSAAGLSAVGRARLELEGGSIAASRGAGLALADEAEARARATSFEGNKTGIALCDRARLTAEAASVAGSQGHGLWLKDAASADLSGGEFSGNEDNGIYLTGAARLELAGGELQGNRCGLAGADQSAAAVEKASFADNSECNVSLTGGEHRLSDCALEGSATGLSAVGRARVELAGGRICGSSGEGLALAGEAQVRSESGVFSGNKTGVSLCGRARLRAEAARVTGSLGHGLWLKEEASAELVGGEFSGNTDNGIYLAGSARLELAGGELQGNRCGLAGADQSAAAVEKASFADNSECNVSLTGGEHRFAGCSLRGSAAGLSAVGRARVELAGCSIRGSGGKGLALAEDARARLEGGTCEGNAMGMELSGRSRLDARSVRVSGSSGHGLWLKEEASAELAGGDFSHNKDNGVYLTGSARLDLKGGRLEGNRCGLACAEQTAAAAERASFLRNSEVNISLGGGGHRFTDCATQDAPLGLALHGAGRAELDLMRFLRNARGSVLAGDSRAAFKACVWVGNEVGLWVQERSAGSLAGGALRRQKEQALRAGQSASLEARGARFQGNMMAVLLEDDARAAVADCAFRGNPTGVKADGRSRLALKGSRVRGCATDGVWLGAQASGDIAGSVFTANRVAVHYHLDAHINLAHNEFHANVYGDACCYSKCSCPPAGVPGQEAACLKA
jgi:nitrous oxidase accessory protein NosD